MKIELNCSKRKIEEREFRAYLVWKYYGSRNFILKLIALIFYIAFMTDYVEPASESRALTNIFTALELLIFFLVLFWAFCPPALFRLKRALADYCSEGYDFILDDKSFVVKGNYLMVDTGWNAVEKVRVKGRVLIFKTRYGSFFLSKGWFKDGQLKELKEILGANGVRNNLR